MRTRSAHSSYPPPSLLVTVTFYAQGLPQAAATPASNPSHQARTAMSKAEESFRTLATNVQSRSPQHASTIQEALFSANVTRTLFTNASRLLGPDKVEWAFWLENPNGDAPAQVLDLFVSIMTDKFQLGGTPWTANAAFKFAGVFRDALPPEMAAAAKVGGKMASVFDDDALRLANQETKRIREPPPQPEPEYWQGPPRNSGGGGGGDYGRQWAPPAGYYSGYHEERSPGLERGRGGRGWADTAPPRVLLRRRHGRCWWGLCQANAGSGSMLWQVTCPG